MDEPALRAWLAEPRTDLIAAVAEGVHAHVATLRARGLGFYGYALNPGEYYDIQGLTAIANAEAGIPPPQAQFNESMAQAHLIASHGEPPPAPLGDEATRYFRYCVDSWQRWDHDAFPAADAILAGLNERFRSLHSKPDGDDSMDEFEVAHADSLLDALVRGLATARDAGAFGESPPFLAVWISDHGIEGIIEDSVKRLNPPQIAADFMEEFG